MKITKLLTVILLLVALGFLIYGYAFSRYKVYNNTVPADPAQSTIMSEPKLMSEMCYNGITADKDGNLLSKQKGNACSNCQYGVCPLK